MIPSMKCTVSRLLLCQAESDSAEGRSSTVRADYSEYEVPGLEAPTVLGRVEGCDCASASYVSIFPKRFVRCMKGRHTHTHTTRKHAQMRTCTYTHGRASTRMTMSACARQAYTYARTNACTHTCTMVRHMERWRGSQGQVSRGVRVQYTETCTHACARMCQCAHKSRDSGEVRPPPTTWGLTHPENRVGDAKRDEEWMSDEGMKQVARNGPERGLQCEEKS